MHANGHKAGHCGWPDPSLSALLLTVRVSKLRSLFLDALLPFHSTHTLRPCF